MSDENTFDQRPNDEVADQDVDATHDAAANEETAGDEQADQAPDEESKPGRVYTQAQVSAIVAREKAKATKGLFSADDMAAKDNSISSLTTERDTARADLQAAQAELESLKREKILIGKGVPAEDVEFFAFKIGKLVKDDLSFEEAATQFFRNHPVKPQNVRRLSSGGSLEGAPVSRTLTPNERANEMLRRAVWNR